MFWVTDQPDLDTKPCKVCAEPIKKAARICNQCKSYQGWLTSKLHFSSTVLALLIALLSVASTSIPMLITALTPLESKLSAILQSVYYHKVSVMFTNAGNRPGTVSTIILDVGTKPLNEVSGRTVYAAERPQLIGPNDQLLLNYEFTGKFEDITKLKRPIEALIRLKLTNFDGTREFTVLALNEGDTNLLFGLPPR